MSRELIFAELEAICGFCLSDFRWLTAVRNFFEVRALAN